MDRKTKEIVLISGLIIVVVVATFYIYKISRKANQMQSLENQSKVQMEERIGMQGLDKEVVESITAPVQSDKTSEELQASLPKEVIESTTAPQNEESNEIQELAPEVKASLTAPTKK